MNIDQVTVEIPLRQAREARDAYREAIRQDKATDADRQLYAAYRAVAQGKRVLDIVDVLQKAGVNTERLPNLAICRASATWAHLYRQNREWWFMPRTTWSRRPRGTVAVPLDTFPVDTRTSVRARVPFIPPQHRPRFQLEGYHLLWDAVWEQALPVDPLLLKHLDGPFYAVLAAWDLTPLEQAVMRGRL